MEDNERNRAQLLEELAVLRQRVTALEANKEDYRQETHQSWSQLIKDQLLIARIGQVISSTLDIDEVYGRFAQEVSNLVPFDRMSINIIDQEAGIFTIKYLTGQEVEGRRIGAIRNVRGTQTEYLLATGQTVVRDDLIQVPKFETDGAFAGEGLRSGIMVSLVSKGKIIGSLSLRSRLAGVYGARERGILEQLAQHIAPAIENAELYQRTRQAEEALRLSQEVEHRLAQRALQ
jgi:GAF domain-containing protein